ncbi:MAG: NAD(P)-dependent oxidoreductase [Myxococcota bacterium]
MTQSTASTAAPILPSPIDARVLITGASGFVGSRLRDALLDAGADVCALRRPTSPAPRRGRSVVGTYADLPGLTALVRGERPDIVFHVAGSTKGVDYEDFARANVMPTDHLLRAVCAAHPDCGRFVYVSSLASYGPSSPDRPLVETDPARPIEHYGRSKRAAEEKVAAVHDQLKTTTIRPAGVYGPGDRDYFNLFREVARGRNVFFGNRERMFSAVHVDDCVRALVAAALAPTTVGRGYFIDDGRPVTWGAFQDAIVAASGRRRVLTLNLPEAAVSLAALGGELASRIDGQPRLLNRQKAKMGAQAAWTCRSDAARADFGFVPAVDLTQGVADTYRWYRTHGWL